MSIETGPEVVTLTPKEERLYLIDLLAEQGYEPQIVPGMWWDPIESMIKRYQTDKGLTVDGLFNGETKARIEADSYRESTNNVSTAILPPPLERDYVEDVTELLGDPSDGVSQNIGRWDEYADRLVTGERTGSQDYSPPYLRSPMVFYLVNLLDGTALPLACIPNEFSESVMAAFSDIPVRGRSTVYKGYNSTGPREMSFTLSLHESLCPLGLMYTVNYLKSLAYPSYQSYIQSPKVFVKVGEFLRFTGVTNNVGVVWKKPYRNSFMQFADVSLDFSEVLIKSSSAKEVRWRGY